MTIVTYASGTTTATGSEQFLTTGTQINVAGEFALKIDRSNMIFGDTLELRVYGRAIASGTTRQIWQANYSSLPLDSEQIVYTPWFPNDLTDDNAMRFSLKQSAGSNESYAWAVMKRQDALTDKTGYALTTAEHTKGADITLRRSLASALASADGDAKSFRSLAGMVCKLVNRVARNGSDIEIYETDDATLLGSQAVTTDALADPITGVDTN